MGGVVAAHVLASHGWRPLLVARRRPAGPARRRCLRLLPESVRYLVAKKHARCPHRRDAETDRARSEPHGACGSSAPPSPAVSPVRQSRRRAPARHVAPVARLLHEPARRLSGVELDADADSAVGHDAQRRVARLGAVPDSAARSRAITIGRGDGSPAPAPRARGDRPRRRRLRRPDIGLAAATPWPCRSRCSARGSASPGGQAGRRPSPPRSTRRLPRNRRRSWATASAAVARSSDSGRVGHARSGLGAADGLRAGRRSRRIAGVAIPVLGQSQLHDRTHNAHFTNQH